MLKGRIIKLTKNQNRQELSFLPVFCVIYGVFGCLSQAFYKRKFRRLLSHELRFGQFVLFDNRNEHSGEAFGVAYPVLHMVVAVEDGIMRKWVGFRYALAVFEVVFLASEFKKRTLLKFLAQWRKGLNFRAFCPRFSFCRLR